MTPLPTPLSSPPARVERLHEPLASFPRQRKTCPKKDLLKLIGELRSMIIALPGGVGCLSWLQERIKATASTRVYLNRQFHDAINDFRWLVGDVCARLTRIGEVVPEAPTEFGRVDASGRGMSGVWLDDDGDLFDASLDPTTLAPDRSPSRGQAVADAVRAGNKAAATPRRAPGGITWVGRRPILWRHRFPEDIVDALVSFDNPCGLINNYKLELAGHVAQNSSLHASGTSLSGLPPRARITPPLTGS